MNKEQKKRGRGVYRFLKREACNGQAMPSPPPLIQVTIIENLLDTLRYRDWLWSGQPRGRSSSPSRVKNFLFLTSSRPALGSTQPPIEWGLGTLSPWVKGLGHEADHSPPASAGFKKMWSYTSTPP
jgi:hypothetical protein